MPENREKTNAMRYLDAQRIPYRAHYFSPEIHSAVGVAISLGLPAGQIFKTLVVMPPAGRPLLAIIPGDQELDLKKTAAAAGVKSVRMATQNEAEALTGLLVGGISALALLNKGFSVYLDTSAQQYDEILVSAGQRGINVQLAVAALQRVTRARLASLAHPAPAA